MAKKKATLDSVAKSIDDLAAITAKGFEQVYKDMGEMKAELKEDIGKVATEIESINTRLEKYYHPTLESHAHRIKALEKA